MSLKTSPNPLLQYSNAQNLILRNPTYTKKHENKLVSAKNN